MIGFTNEFSTIRNRSSNDSSLCVTVSTENGSVNAANDAAISTEIKINWDSRLLKDGIEVILRPLYGLIITL